jgi:hypothetical protein
MNLKHLPEIHVDWNDAYGKNCVALDCDGSLQDIREQAIVLKEGLRVYLYGDMYEAEALIRPFELNGYTFLVAEIVDGTHKEIPQLKPWRDSPSR